MQASFWAAVQRHGVRLDWLCQVSAGGALVNRRLAVLGTQ